MKNFIIFIISLLLIVVSALFFAQNDASLVINYFNGQANWQLNWVMLGCFLIGFFVGLASILGSLLKVNILLKKTETKLKRAQKELNSLRALPIKDEY